MALAEPCSPSRAKRDAPAWTFASAFALGLIASLCARPARAESTIRNPGQRTDYHVELEPHGLVAPFDAPGPGRGRGFGAGLRVTVPIVKNGFIQRLNNSVGIGFGADWALYTDRDRRGECTRFQTGPNATSVCVEVDGSGSRSSYLLFPVVMQWNFWLARRWSVFGEPGFFFYTRSGEFGWRPAALFGGGRFHFSQNATLTLRVGYPTLSLGVSFLL